MGLPVYPSLSSSYRAPTEGGAEPFNEGELHMHAGQSTGAAS